VEWRIYYGDGSTYDEGLLINAPAVNVRCIVVRDPEQGSNSLGRVILTSWDYYLYVPGRGWYGVNGEVDLIDHLLHECPIRVLKGRLLATGKYDEIRKRAIADPDFPRKSAHDPVREDGCS